MTARKTFERVFRFLVPSWLIEGDGDAVLRSLTRLVDENVDRFREGLNARFPSRATDTSGALELLGQDRGIVRGRTETAAHYAARLVAWRYPRGHRVRGSAFALLNQVSEYWGGVACQTIDASGTLHERDARGVERFAYGRDWVWDSRPTSEWSRFWVLLDGTPFAAAQPDLGDPSLWGGALGTPGYTVGQTGVLVDDVLAMRRLLTGRAWRPAGTQPEWLIVILSASLAAAPSTWDASLSPDTYCERWSIAAAGVRVASRDSRCRYWSLDPAHNNTWTPPAAPAFCAQSVMPGGATYTASADWYDSVTLADGSTYTPVAAWHESVRLPDDGDTTQ